MKEINAETPDFERPEDVMPWLFSKIGEQDEPLRSVLVGMIENMVLDLMPLIKEAVEHGATAEHILGR